MSGVAVNWGTIRAINGSRAKGFEELCTQLARAECPPEARFERKGTPDAGVECYCVLPNGQEWGWQAEYFLSAIGDTQWSQIDGSIKTALAKHPQLERYYVCVPRDRSDARLQHQQSERERWDEHAQKWEEWAAGRGMSVEFIYWGSHEILEQLARPTNVGKLRFFFDARGFDQEWFASRVEEALKTAGPRYSPKVHVELPIVAELEALGRTSRFFDRIKSLARDIRRELRYSRPLVQDSPDEELAAKESELFSRMGTILSLLGEITVEPIRELPFQQIDELSAAAQDTAEQLEELLLRREKEHDARRRISEAEREQRRYSQSPFGSARFRVVRVISELRSTREALQNATRTAGTSLMILKGAAGTGKTHLLCDGALQRAEAGMPTVLLMGQQFVSTEPPSIQALQHLDLVDLNLDEFVGALEASAQAANCRALVIVDAINEGAGRQIWPPHLAAFTAHFERSPWIGILLSVRTSYEDIIVPEDVSARAVHVVHQGFAGIEFDAVRTYFSHFGIELPSTPLLAPEFNNPFYLKTLCVGLTESGHKKLPRGFQGITFASRLFLDAVNKRLSRMLGFDQRTPLVHEAVKVLAETMVASGNRWIPRPEAQRITDDLLPGREFEQSLYRGLVMEGVVAEEVGPHPKDREEVVYVGYDRLADHFVADAMLRKIGVRSSNPNEWRRSAARFAFRLRLWLSLHITMNELWRSLCSQRTYFPQGVLEALCVQVPERVGSELNDVCPKVSRRAGIGPAFRQSLVWRSPASVSSRTLDALNALVRTDEDWFDTLDAVLTVATLPDHPLNGEFLHQRLLEDSMPDRDSWWSIFLHHTRQTQGAVDRIVEWAWSVRPEDVLDETTVGLCSTALAWMLTTSNRFLRDRATKALVSLLTGRLGAATRLVQRFADVDDPYVAERIYAVACGVAMRTPDPKVLRPLAQLVYDQVFANQAPPAHILPRDYARGVVERAIHLGADLEVDTSLIRPPYDSVWPEIPSEEEIKPYLPDWSRGSHDSGNLEWARNVIGTSVMEDDFARYVIGTNWSSSNWLGLRLDEPPWRSTRAGERAPRIDLGIIQRYVLWRVFDLGWTTERFGEFDRYAIGFHGRAAGKAERLGKKYQWIAYHEILALIADHFQYREEFREEHGDKEYCGPWQERLRDIDPCCDLRVCRGGTSLSGHALAWWAPISYDAWETAQDPSDWVKNWNDLPKLDELLVAKKPDDGSRWLNLSAYLMWQQPIPPDREATDVERREIWYTVTGHFIREDDVKSFLDWAAEQDFWGRWMMDEQDLREVFLGEYGWAEASRYLEQPYHGDYGWTHPGRGCPVQLRVAASEYVWESSGFDCSLDDTIRLKLPVRELCAGMNLRWNGNGAEFVTANGATAAFDPTALEEGPDALLVRMDHLKEFLDAKDYTICWAVLGEKRALGPGIDPAYRHSLRLTGAYALRGDRIEGFLKCILDLRDEGSGEGQQQKLAIIRTQVH